MTDESKKIDARQAAKIAKDELLSLIPEAREILLEEVEMKRNGDEAIWCITLSFVYQKEPDQPKIATRLFMDIDDDRKYKTFSIDARTGEVFAMKIGPL